MFGERVVIEQKVRVRNDKRRSVGMV